MKSDQILKATLWERLLKKLNYKPGWWAIYFCYCAIPVVAYIYFLAQRVREVLMIIIVDQKFVRNASFNYFGSICNNISFASNNSFLLYPANSVLLVSFIISPSLLLSRRRPLYNELLTIQMPIHGFGLSMLQLQDCQ